MIEKRNGNLVANVGRLKGGAVGTMFSTLSDRTTYCKQAFLSICPGRYAFRASKRGNERYVYDCTLSPV
jgi:hypothetical protein